MPKKKAHRRTSVGQRDPLVGVRSDRLTAALDQTGLPRREIARTLRRRYRVRVAPQTLDYVAAGKQAKMRRSQLDGLVALLRDRGTPIPREWLTGATDGLPFLPLNSLFLVDLEGSGAQDPDPTGSVVGLAALTGPPWRPLPVAADTAIALNGLLHRVRTRALAEGLPLDVVSALVAAVSNIASSTAGRLYSPPRYRGAPVQWIQGLTTLLTPWLEGRWEISIHGLATLVPTLYPKHRNRLLEYDRGDSDAAQT